METSFELTLTAVLNISTADWSTPHQEVRYSNALAVIFLVFLSVLSFFLVVFYCYSFSKLDEPDFKEKYSSGLEGNHLSKKVSPRSILAFPAIFFGRRILFAVIAVYLQDFLWG